MKKVAAGCLGGLFSLAALAWLAWESERRARRRWVQDQRDYVALHYE